jgi:hypothetical protein
VLRYVDSTPDVMFLKKCSLRALVVHVAKCWNIHIYCITCQSFRDDVHCSDLVTSKTIPHVYGSGILVVTSELSTWIIIIIAYTSVSATCNSMTG